MSVAPTHYDLTFEPDFEEFTFKGRAVIFAWCFEPHTEIEMDAADLTIHSCRVWCDDREVNASADVDESEELLTVRTSEFVQGQCTILLEYTGVLQ